MFISKKIGELLGETDFFAYFCPKLYNIVKIFYI